MYFVHRLRVILSAVDSLESCVLKSEIINLNSKITMERFAKSIIQIKTVYVTKPFQKINFQFRHPENAKNIVGLLATCDLFADFRFRGLGHQVGTLALSHAQKGDIFYSQTLRLDDNTYTQALERIVYPTLTQNSFAKSGKQMTWFKTTIPVTHAIIDCYFEDTLSATHVGGGLSGTLPYEIVLYIQYELK